MPTPTIELSDLLRILFSNHTPTDVPQRSPQHWKIGEWYLIRTVTMTDVGKLAYIDDKELVLENSSWIADTGRFADCLKDPDVIELAEPFTDPVIINRDSIVDATRWRHQNVEQK